VARVFWPSGPTHGGPLFLLFESMWRGTHGTKSRQQPGKCLILWMKVYVFIINLLSVYRCFNNCTTKVAAICRAVAWVFLPSGPTHGGLPYSFSSSLVGVVPLVPNLVNNSSSACQVKLSSDVSCLNNCLGACEFSRVPPCQCIL
jgi:hypothetical protein